MIGPMLALLPLLASAAPAPAAQPASPTYWAASYRSGRCTIIQRSEDGSGPTLALQRAPDSTTTAFRVLDPAWTIYSIEDPRTVELVLKPTGRTFTRALVDRIAAGYMIEVMGRDLDLAEFAASTSILIREGGADLLELPLRDAPAAVAALRQCEEARLREWGVDLAARAALKSQPEPTVPLGSVIRRKDYPKSALRKGVRGDTVVRLDIGIDGRVERCAVVGGSGREELDVAACSLLQRRLSFKPAVNAAGEAVATPVIISISWNLVAGS